MGTRKQVKLGISNEGFVYLEAEYTLLSKSRVYIPYQENVAFTGKGEEGTYDDGSAIASVASDQEEDAYAALEDGV